jgi:general secretion pathway protein I
VTRRDGSAGFTLIELLVALAIFALAALTLLRMEGVSISQTADLSQRIGREIAAQNLAVDLLTNPLPPAMGEENGSVEALGRTFTWQRSVEPAEFPGLLRITLSVSEGQGQAVTLTLVRPLAQP